MSEKIFKKWKPKNEIKNHDGTPIESKSVFIVPPPEEIGEVLSASSTFSKYHPIFLFKLFVKYFALVGKFVLISFIAGGIAIVSIWILSIWDWETNKTLNTVAMILLIVAIPGIFHGILYFLYVKILLRKIYYIGKNGIGIFSFTFPFKRVDQKCQVFFYNDIKSIKIEQTHHYDKQLSTRYKYTKTEIIVYGREVDILFLDTLKKHYNENNNVFSNHPINFYLKAKQMLQLNQIQYQND